VKIMCADSLNICFVSSQYPPHTIGGAGTYAACLCRELAKLGHKVHAIIPSHNSTIRPTNKNGVFIHKVSVPNKSFLKTLSFWLKIKKIYEKIEKKVGFDVLHSNVTSDLSLTRHSIKIPRIVTVHHLAKTTFETVKIPFSQMLTNLNTETSLLSWIEKKTLDLDKIVVKRAQKIIAVSNFVRKSLISSYKLAPSKISVIYNGVDWKDFQIDPNEIMKVKKLYNVKEDNVILYVGRIEPRKGINLLLEAFSILIKKTKRKCRLFIVGSGNQTFLWKTAQRMRITHHLTLIDRVNSDSLKKIYGLSNVFVLPSLLEGFGLTLLEAMAAGKPIVALNVGGIPEIVKDGVNGKLVDKKPTELASALKFFIENPDIAERIGNINKRYVADNFRWEKTARETLDVYKEAMDQTDRNWRYRNEPF